MNWGYKSKDKDVYFSIVVLKDQGQGHVVDSIKHIWQTEADNENDVSHVRVSHQGVNMSNAKW